MPAECIAEEIYYFLFDPRQGFAVQCLYTADGSLDEAYRVKNDELVEFPYGYHTTVSTPGYQTYFLWLMAGDYQASTAATTRSTTGSNNFLLSPDEQLHRFSRGIFNRMVRI